MAGLRVGVKEQLYLSKNSSEAAAGQCVKASVCSLAQRAYQQYLPPALVQLRPGLSSAAQEVTGPLCNLRACHGV